MIRPYTFILSVFVLFLLPEKKAKLIVHPLINGDSNGNLILEPMFESVDEEAVENEKDDQRMERLRNQYDEKNLK